MAAILEGMMALLAAVAIGEGKIEGLLLPPPPLVALLFDPLRRIELDTYRGKGKCPLQLALGPKEPLSEPKAAGRSSSGILVEIGT